MPPGNNVGPNAQLIDDGILNVIGSIGAHDAAQQGPGPKGARRQRRHARVGRQRVRIVLSDEAFRVALAAGVDALRIVDGFVGLEDVAGGDEGGLGGGKGLVVGFILMGEGGRESKREQERGIGRTKSSHLGRRPSCWGR